MFLEEILLYVLIFTPAGFFGIALLIALLWADRQDSPYREAGEAGLIRLQAICRNE